MAPWKLKSLLQARATALFQEKLFLGRVSNIFGVLLEKLSYDLFRLMNITPFEVDAALLLMYPVGGYFDLQDAEFSEIYGRRGGDLPPSGYTSLHARLLG